MKNNFILAPSILSANFSNIADEIKKVVRAGCQWIHLDVMDGHFVPNITFGPLLVKALREINKKLFFDVHLMIEEPIKFVEQFVEAGADLITIHQEAVEDDLLASVQYIKSQNVKVGVSVKPKTPISVLKPVYSKINLILVMSVEPGFGGQELIPSTLNKVRQLKLLKEKKKYPYLIEIDGGINQETIKLSIAAGAEVIVVGSAVFDDGKIAENIKKLRESVSRTHKVE